MATTAASTELVPHAKKMENFRGSLLKLAPQIKMALPKHISADRLARIALTEVQRTPKLLDCTQASLFGAIMQAAALGLEPGGGLGHCYLIPYEDRKNERVICQFIPGYKGLLDLAHRSNRVQNIYARVVYEGDEFEYQMGTNESITHKRGLLAVADINKADKIVAAYAVAWMKGADRPHFEVMTATEIEAIRLRSRAQNSGPWVTDRAEMCKKTVLRRICKFLPLSSEIARAVALDEQVDANLDQQFDGAIDIAAEEPANDQTLAVPTTLDDLKTKANRVPGEEG